MKTPTPQARILLLDLENGQLTATVLDPAGNPLTPYERIPTPRPGTPEAVLSAVEQATAQFGGFDYISMGFPGYVRNGTVQTAPHLGTADWAGVYLQGLLTDRFQRPAQVVNDADLLGMGIAEGQGVELVVTLGIGIGSAFLLDGELLPHLELAHHPLKEGLDYDQYIGQEELDRIGVDAWNGRMREVIEVLETVFHYDTLHLGGENAKLIDFELGPRVRRADSIDGIRGGCRLWTREIAALPR